MPPCPPSKSCYTTFRQQLPALCRVPCQALTPQHLIQQQPPVKEGARGHPHGPHDSVPACRSPPSTHIISYPARLSPCLRKRRHREVLGLAPLQSGESQPRHLHTTLHSLPKISRSMWFADIEVIPMAELKIIAPPWSGTLGWRPAPSMDIQMCLQIQSHLLQEASPGLLGWVGSFLSVSSPRPPH